MSLTLSSQPGFTQIPNSSFQTGSPVSASVMLALNAAAQFAAVRGEQFYGYYRNGETVSLPVSPADGYQYSRAELLYVPSWYCTASAPSALNGTTTAPTPGATSGAGTVLYTLCDVNESTGLVQTFVAYYKDGGAQSNTNDGILKVMTLALRNR